jgi:hypothetical protein
MRRHNRPTSWLLPIVTLVLIHPPSPALAAGAKTSSTAEPVQDLWALLKLKPYGFLRLDVIYDDSRMNNSQFAFWVLSEDPSQNPENDNRLTIHPRLTRIGMNVGPYALGETASIKGQVEIDFQNGGRESRQIMRMRTGFLSLSAGGLELLAGQASDLISPLLPAANNDGVMWNAGNLGDRRPQVRLTYAPSAARGKFIVGAAGMMTGAVDEKDLDTNMQGDGFESATPSLQILLGLEQSLWTDALTRFGLWGHWAREKTSKPIGTAETRTFVSLAGGAHLSLPILEWLALEGEVWLGQNLSDVRGGIGQGVNAATGQEIRAVGGWGQLALSVIEQLHFFAGASIDKPRLADLAPGQRRTNWTIFGVLRFRPVKPLQIALEYIYWQTEYVALRKGTDNRGNLHFSFFF